MAANENGGTDYYAVLGVKKDCSDGELKTAYKKLALRWHPDRCSASGNSKYVEEAKRKFQEIQEAYSVLSDKSKRIMYNCGVYDSTVDEGLTEFMDEIVDLMRQQEEKQSSENVVQSYEDLKTLFEDMFHDDLVAINYSFESGVAASSSSSMFGTAEKPESGNKRSYETTLREDEVEKTSCFDTQFKGFNFGADNQQSLREGGCVPGEYKSRRTGRKQKVSADHDVSYNNNAGIC